MCVCVKSCSGNGRGWLGAGEEIACAVGDNLLVKPSLPSPSPAGRLLEPSLGIAAENLGSRKKNPRLFGRGVLNVLRV